MDAQLYNLAYDGPEIDEATRRAYEVFSGDNVLINSAFQINQHGVSGTVELTAGVYGHDGWKAGASGCTYTFATSGGVTTVTISAGSLVQVVEGINLETDTYCMSWAGTAQGKIGTGSYGTSGITGTVTGGTSLSVEFGTGTLSEPKLEQGAVATPYRKHDSGVELWRCQQYYFRISGSSATIGTGWVNDASNVLIAVYYPVTMRSDAPTINWSSVDDFIVRNNYAAATSISINTRSNRMAMMLFTKTSAYTAGYGCDVYIANGTGYLEVSCEP